MKKSLVYKHFRSLQAIADALGITKSAVSQWRVMVPEGTAYKLQCITGGALRVDAKAYRHRGRGKSRKAA